MEVLDLDLSWRVSVVAREVLDGIIAWHRRRQTAVRNAYNATRLLRLHDNIGV